MRNYNDIAFYTIGCRDAAADIIQASTLPCTEICQDDLRNQLREKCSWNSNQGEPCMTVTVTATHTPLAVTITPTCSPLLVASSRLPLATRAPKFPTTVITEYSSITPTNCLQSTQSKEMSTAVGTVITNTATGDTNNSPVILGAFIAVLAALLVAVTTGWIVMCVLNKRKDKASTTRYTSKPGAHICSASVIVHTIVLLYNVCDSWIVMQYKYWYRYLLSYFCEAISTHNVRKTL